MKPSDIKPQIIKPFVFDRNLFGKIIRIIIYDSPFSDAGTGRIIDEMYSEALRLQKIFNFFDAESELSILNQKRKMKVSKELFEVLEKSLLMSKMTGGKYDISLGKSILARKKGMNKSGNKSNKESGISCSYKDIKIDGNFVSIGNQNAIIDLGSIAKGYMTDKMGDFLKEKEIKEFLIDSRGDILFSGAFQHIIGIQHPRIKDRNVCMIKVNNNGVATSGDYNQYYGNFENSHIINSNDVISATVISKTLTEADMLTTPLFVSNKEGIAGIMNKYRDSMAFIIRKDLSLEYYNGFEKIIQDNNQGIK